MDAALLDFDSPSRVISLEQPVEPGYSPAPNTSNRWPGLGRCPNGGCVMKRLDRENEQDRSEELVSGLAAAETMRTAVQAAHDKGETSKRDEEKLSIFWRVFGGTILSIIALMVINLFNNLYGTIGELRAEINKEREARSELVKKDEFNTRITSQYERIRAAESMQNTLAALRSEHDGLKEAVKANAAAVEAVKKEAAALDSIRERIVTLETIKKDFAGLDVAKEKLAALALDVKTLRDDFSKVNQEIAQNRAFDLERKSFRDNQARQFDDTVKELNKAVQEIREKMARIEGQQPVPVPPMAPKAIKLTARPRVLEPEAAPLPGNATPASGEKE